MRRSSEVGPWSVGREKFYGITSEVASGKRCIFENATVSDTRDFNSLLILSKFGPVVGIISFSYLRFAEQESQNWKSTKDGMVPF